MAAPPLVDGVANHMTRTVPPFEIGAVEGEPAYELCTATEATLLPNVSTAQPIAHWELAQ